MENPLMRQEKRQAQPTSVFGRFHGQGNLGSGLGLKSHGMAGFPKVGANVSNPQTGGIGSMGVKPIKSFDDGGMYSDSTPQPGDYNYSQPNVAQTSPYAPGPNVPQMAHNLQSQGAPVQQSVPSAQQGGDYGVGLGNIPGLSSQTSSQSMASQGINANQQNSGMGKQAMNAGITALTGILANIGNQQMDKAATKQNAAAKGNSNMGVSLPAPSIRRAVGGMIPSRYCSGGDMSYAAGGMSAGDCYNDGGLDSTPQQSATPSVMPQQPRQGSPQQVPQPGQQQPVGQARPDANSPQSQMLVAQAIKALLGQSKDPQGDIQQFVQHFGPDALQALVQKVKESQQSSQGGQGQAPQAGGIAQGQNAPTGASSPAQTSGIAPGMASGGMTGSRDADGSLSGPGDGMSDDIHANGSQVRVADGEYVVPADAVSQLGNGSSSAGAKKLTSGIAKLRTQKYGKAKQPKKLSPGQNPILS